jgi:hypothetical protein
MTKRWVWLTIGLVAVLLLPGTSFAALSATPHSSVTAGSAPSVPAGPVAGAGVGTVPVGGSVGVYYGGHQPSQPAAVTVASSSQADPLPSTFWGVNTPAEQAFSVSDAAKVAATPVTFLRYPGGLIAEGFNYTSGVIRNIDGTTVQAGTSVSSFIASCQSIGCRAIMELPAEIDQPYTAAYYANYVVNQLHFQPAYWEIGNAVPGWPHFQTPWSKWGTTGGNTIDPTIFANLVKSYITNVSKVDSGARFIALGSGMGPTNYAENWISALVAVDGHLLSGVSLHSYYIGSSPPQPTWPELFSHLNGYYSLPDQIAAVRGFLRSDCGSCGLKIFVTEANAAEVDTFQNLLSSFAGPLYLAADVAQAIDLRVYNVDWFCDHCRYPGAWDNGGRWQGQYALFSQVLPSLGNETLKTTVTGPSTFYAAATYGGAGLGLLLVNVNMTEGVQVNLTGAGIKTGSVVGVQQWQNGSSGPSNSTTTLQGTLALPPLSITLLTAGPSEMKASDARAQVPALSAHRAAAHGLHPLTAAGLEPATPKGCGEVAHPAPVALPAPARVAMQAHVLVTQERALRNVT